ncbi:hypothetical protein [Micromonospora sp. NPDC047134]|uniref:hypothetical protein n=1 Tax=Micromonospora sp. NPDC047134 TaxID=3154340 RepID=UPI00340F3538
MSDPGDSTGTPDPGHPPAEVGSGRRDRPRSPRLVAAAAGVVLVAGAVADLGPEESSPVEISVEAGPTGSVRDQFARAFTRGPAWDPPVVLSIKPPPKD